ncbi:putative sgt1 and cs domain containing protein [Erysiphe necator]|uniref:Putative sgt1 and cs domain containing protein n=1 Tax=Uncinula necator TaxID=52586 RepID=A0A0B1P669_UNCNE|nr:putative sgt1 and cs domain containing protein [Erysiphe necator]
MSGDAIKGKALLDSGDYQSAVKYLSEALKSSQAPTWLLLRSTAHHRLGKHGPALHDANKALLISINRGKRELIAESHYRRGIVLHGLRQYGDSRMCFYWARKYNEKLPGLSMWISRVSKDYDANGGEQAECNAITVKEVPDVVEEHEQKIESPQSHQSSLLDKENEKSKINVPAEGINSALPNSKIRHEWYQSNNTVTVEILAKNTPKETITVNIQERSLEVSFTNTSAQNTCYFAFEPLFSKIDISKSSYRATPHKIEISLHKSNSGVKWPSLELSESVSLKETLEDIQDVRNDSNDIKTRSQAPVYPTSSKTGPKNWDTVIGKEAEEDDADGPDAFFKMLYRNADPDTKRAMIKSYQESNGTSLSTQWSDVGSRKFEIIPPEGVEVKKWDT